VYKDTKRLHEFLGADKSYETTIDFSKISDTWDMDYWEKYEEYVVDNNEVVIDGVRKSAPSLEQLKKKLDSLIPSATLPLTPFSAKKKNGKKLYELARAGVEVNESREMVVNSYEIVSYAFPVLTLKLDVGS
jgi:tRNA pseudouridine55 synthase